MNITVNKTVENQLLITETDYVGGGEALIIRAYVSMNNENFNFNYDVINEEIFERNKAEYLTEIIKFRNNCEAEMLGLGMEV